ncbi:MAG: DUF4019 domain-containing protein [Waddliaceae bacterium]
MIKTSLRAAFYGFLLLSFFSLPAASVVRTDDAFKASAQAAQRWLQLVDQGKYEQSLGVASANLRLIFPRQRWVYLMQNIRKPLGQVRSRKLLDQKEAKDPPNLPKGNYMVIVYGTSFSRRKSAHELVTLVQGRDGRWRVLTYLVQ